MPGKEKKESILCIPLPFKVRDVNPKVHPLKRDFNASRMLHISMELAAEPKNIEMALLTEGFQSAD